MFKKLSTLPETHTHRVGLHQTARRLSLGIAALTLVAASVVPASAQTEDGVHERRGKHRNPGAMALRAADADGDRQVTAAEWQQHVASLDADGDGIITKEEMIDARAERAKERAEKREAGPATQRLDTNGDGFVSTTEMTAAFATMDTDGDGVVSKADMPERSRNRRGPRGRVAGHLLSQADTDGDKQLAQAEWQSFLAGIDTNSDGLLSADEMATLRPDGAPEPRGERPDVELATLEGAFDRVDANDDGVITEDEWPQPGQHGRRGRGRRGARGPR